MNPELLDAIHQVERKYGTVCNPFANLSKIHHIAMNLGLYGAKHYNHKNRLYKVHGEYLTFNPKIMKIYYLLLNHRSVNFIRCRVHVDGGVIRHVRTIIHIHRKIQLVDESSILSIEG